MEEVAVIVDPDYGPQLDRIASRHPVWIVETRANRDAAEKLWGHGASVTTFKVEDPQKRLQNLLGILDTVHLHHGSDSQWPPYRFLHIIGVTDRNIAERLREVGFVDCRDSADGVIAKVGPEREDPIATFSIDISFIPRTIEPAEISQRLHLEPTWHWRAGERVRNQNGTLRPYPARESRWSLTIAYFDRREDERDLWNETDEYLGPRLNERLTAFLEPFLRESSFVREVVADSAEAYIGLNFPGQFHFGFMIEPATLSAIAGLNLEFGFEIFRDSRGPYVDGDPNAGVPLRIVGNQGMPGE